MTGQSTGSNTTGTNPTGVAAEYQDVSASRVAQVYAQALWNAANNQQQTEAIVAEYQELIEQVLPNQPSLRQFVENKVLSRDQRAHILQQTFGQVASPLLFNFMLTLNRHDRLELVVPAGLALLRLRDQMLRRQAVLVKSAVPLPPEQLDRLRQLLAQRLQIEPIITAEVASELLGGLWLRVGDTVYDRSVRWNLNQLREAMQARATYEV